MKKKTTTAITTWPKSVRRIWFFTTKTDDSSTLNLSSENKTFKEKISPRENKIAERRNRTTKFTEILLSKVLRSRLQPVLQILFDLKNHFCLLFVKRDKFSYFNGRKSRNPDRIQWSLSQKIVAEVEYYDCQKIFQWIQFYGAQNCLKDRHVSRNSPFFRP